MVVCLVCFVPGFFAIPPVDRDEARFAQASRQMLESGDFVDIRFQDEARYKKLVGIYWLQAASVAALGEGSRDAIWAYRIPSLIGATLAVLLTAWCGSRLFGPVAGTLGALMLAGSVLLGVEARLAKTDAALLATIVAAQIALARVYLAEDDAAAGRAAPLAFWIAAGIGILIKGPVLPLVCGGTAFWLVLTERRLAWLKRLRWAIGVPIAALIVLPWLVAITVMTDGAFLAASFGHDMFGKVATGQESHGAPTGSYLVAFWLTFWPFALLAGLAIPWAWRQRVRPEVRFALGWIVPTWLVFELSVTKLPHYVLPTYPAIALLAAAALEDRYGWKDAAAVRWRAWWPAIPWGIATLALPVAVAAVPFLLQHEQVPLPARIAALLAIPIAFGVLVAVRRLQPERALLLGVAAAIVLYVPAYGFVFPNLTGLWLSPRVAEAIETHSPCPDPQTAAAGYHEPSLVFAIGADLELTDGTGAADFLLEGGCRIAIVSAQHAERFAAALGERDRRATALSEVAGTELNGGDRLTLTLYALRFGGGLRK